MYLALLPADDSNYILGFNKSLDKLVYSTATTTNCAYKKRLLALFIILNLEALSSNKFFIVFDIHRISCAVEEMCKVWRPWEGVKRHSSICHVLAFTTFTYFILS